MVAGAIAGNISAEATTPIGNTFAEAMRGILRPFIGEADCVNLHPAYLGTVYRHYARSVCKRCCWAAYRTLL